MFSTLEIWFASKAWPALKTLFASAVHSEVEVLTPIAQQAIADLTTEEATALASGDTKDTGHILAKVVANTAAQAKDATLHSVLVAVGGALPTKTAAP